jgi:HEAT repeat protein
VSFRIATIVLTLLAATATAGPGEPLRYEGKTVAEWAERLEVYRLYRSGSWTMRLDERYSYYDESGYCDLVRGGVEALPFYVELLGQPELSGARYAGSDLVKHLYRSRPEDVIEALVQALDHANPRVPLAVCEVLSDSLGHPDRLARATPRLLRCVREGAAILREAAATTLASLNPTTAVALIGILGHETTEIRRSATRALLDHGRWHVAGPDAVVRLLALLHHEHKDVRAAAALLLAGAGPNNSLVREALQRVARGDVAPIVRRASVRALCGMGFRSEEDVAVFVKAASDKDPATAAWAIQGLARIGPGGAAIKAVLLKAMGRSLPRVEPEDQQASDLIGNEIGWPALRANIAETSSPRLISV